MKQRSGSSRQRTSKLKLTFLGTRGNIDVRTRAHRLHTSTLVAYRGRRVMIDCGEDWRKRVARIAPDAIVLTHAHDDHAFGLRGGSPCPVYASREVWDAIGRFPIPPDQRHVLLPRRLRRIAGIGFRAFPVEHSVRAPAVGFRITAGGVAVFYVPDVLDIPRRGEALRRIRLYVGDGAALVRPVVQRETLRGRLVGHTTIGRQLAWCSGAGVPRMVVTHCGRSIVAVEPARVRARLASLAREHGGEVVLARDGMDLAV